jgi:hypothetical protein
MADNGLNLLVGMRDHQFAVGAPALHRHANSGNRALFLRHRDWDSIGVSEGVGQGQTMQLPPPKFLYLAAIAAALFSTRMVAACYPRTIARPRGSISSPPTREMQPRRTISRTYETAVWPRMIARPRARRRPKTWDRDSQSFLGCGGQMMERGQHGERRTNSPWETGQPADWCGGRRRHRPRDAIGRPPFRARAFRHVHGD